MAILFLLIICLMITVGTFLMSSIEDTYSNSFISNMKKFNADLDDSQIISDDVVSNDEEYAKELFKVFKTYFQIDDTTKKGYLLSATGEIVLPENKNGINEDFSFNENIILAMSGKIGDKMQSDEHFDYAKPIIIDGQVKYICYLRQNKDSINEIVNSLKKSIGYVLLASLLMSIIISYIISRAITIPVSKLMKSAEKMANGDFTKIKESQSGDEISMLATKFNYMGQKLKSTMNEISKEKSKLETLLQNMNDGVIAFDVKGEVIHANPSAQKLIGITGESLKFEDVFSQIGLNLSFEAVANAAPGTFNAKQVSANGKYLNLLFAKFADTEQEGSGVIVVIQDITEQEKLEKMRKEFVANVSHELKTPITSIRGYSETLLDGGEGIDTETAGKFLDVINKEAERMARLVSDLLKLSKMDIEETASNRNSFDIVHLTKICIEKMFIEAEKKGQELVLFNDNENVKAYANEEEIEQVILNILSNAIKYTQDGGKIGVKIDKLSGGEVQIRVRDNGIGIPKEDLPRVFERFYRVDKARSRDMGGTGLGLAIAKTMIEANSGTINIESEVGMGTEVIITLKSLES